MCNALRYATNVNRAAAYAAIAHATDAADAAADAADAAAADAAAADAANAAVLAALAAAYAANAANAADVAAYAAADTAKNKAIASIILSDLELIQSPSPPQAVVWQKNTFSRTICRITIVVRRYF